jgi:hypothetical protein
MPVNQAQSESDRFASRFGSFTDAFEYVVDAAQRSVLFWDVMRQKGNAYREHVADTAPHVLEYEVELVLDGRTFARPVNYCLVRVVPPQGTEVDMTCRPFVVMGTRCGQIDPGVLLYLIQQKGMDPAAVQDLLYRDSGLKSISGISGDVRDLETSTNPAAKLAIDYFVYRIGLYAGMLELPLVGSTPSFSPPESVKIPP